MTKDMASREKKTKREVIMKIFWGNKKGDIQRGQQLHPCTKIRGKERERLEERDGHQFSVHHAFQLDSCSSSNNESAD